MHATDRRWPGAATRRAALAAAAATLAGVALRPAEALAQAQALTPALPPRRARLRLAGPPAAVSFPLMRLVENGALAPLAEQVSFTLWKDPDQLRALVLGGQADVVALPSNVAANLYNRGVRLRLLNVATWGVLWLVSRDAGARTLADFKGREIAMPFRADMPDLVFRLLAQRSGLDPQRDIRLRYVGTPLDAMQLLITRRVDHALLAEPAVSMALRKTRSFPVSLIAPDLHRSVDLQQEWGRLYRREPRIPQAGLALMPALRDDAALAAALQTHYAAALADCEARPEACGASVVAQAPVLETTAVADSVRADNARFATAAQARPELEFFFNELMRLDPGMVGGKLPAADFYFG